ncbi:hypothetical protein A6A04_00485 [Paramagnetospirillum marisnigri]|uniref:Sel1 repeat family protein n=1 Tax=Paramagnetospirillum marisnigri TaxID=1285242 RepID=A0A178MTY0_9PROT|nr:SEL1-like repeat protein [Paramagnetospirillum marisnigri]OAN52214.1 hypothetical protein A6A04_00485 [Paramagnetospirillum marisnigri]
MRIAVLVAALAAIGLSSVAQAETARPVKAKAPAKAAKPVVDSPLVILTNAANRGEAEAQRQLGQAYRDGHGVKADIHAALGWFGLAVANGSAAAALDAADLYQRGHGVKRDMEQAAQWLYHAGVLGDAGARDKWVELVLSGEVASLGGGAGVEWLVEAAGRGDNRAPMILADAFERGQGVAANEDAAEGWLRVAITRTGDLEAEYRLGRLLLARPAYWRMPTLEEWNLKEAERKGLPFGAIPFTVKPTGQEDKILSQMRPGMVEGERRLTAAARRGHAEAQFLLGKSLVTGMELPMDMPRGIGWLEAAASQGHAEATITLAALAAEGFGHFARDAVRAFVLYDLAAAEGEPAAAAARDAVAKGLNQRQLGRARAMVQGFRELQQGL